MPLFATALLVSCSQGNGVQAGEVSSEGFASLTKVEDKTLCDELFSFTLGHNHNIPGQFIDISVLWTSIATEYPSSPKGEFGEPTENTYLGEVKETNSTYYFIYINGSKAAQYQSWISEYVSSAEASFGSFQFDPSLACRDGKYLLAARENNDTELIAYQGSSLKEAPASTCDYELALVLQTKTLTLKENVSLGTKVDQDITLLHRVSVKGSESGEGLTATESTNFFRTDSFYGDNGERLIAFGRSIPEVSYLEDESFAYTQYVSISGNKISLPRYSDGQDMLSEGFTGIKDIYPDYKAEFLQAYLGEDSSQQGYGFYDLPKVESIIKGIKDGTL